MIARLTNPRVQRALVALLAVAVFAPSIAYDFVYDDVFIISARPLLHSLANWREILVAPWWDYSLYRPLTQIMFALEWVATDGRPALFHANNVLLHAVATMLVFVLGRRVIGGGAVFAAAVFAVHPVHVEAVANIVGRAEILSTVGALLAVLAYDEAGAPERSRRARSLFGFAALGALLAGVASKETAFAVPGLMLMMDWFRALQRSIPLGKHMRSRAPLWFAAVITSVAWLGFRGLVLGDVAGDYAAPGLLGLSALERIPAMSPVILEYLRLFFFPVRLLADYSPSVITPTPVWSPAAIVGLGTAVAVAGVAIAKRRQSPGVFFAVGWTGAALMIVANVIVPSGVVLAERTLYLSTVGVCLGLGVALAWLTDRRRAVGLGAVFLILVLGTARSVTRAPVWSHDDRLFASIVFDSPQSYRAMWIAASVAYDRGDLALADSLLRGSIVSFPLHPGVWESMARVAKAGDRWANAANYHRAASRLQLNLKLPPARENLGHAVVAFLTADMLDSARVAAADLQTAFPNSREGRIAGADVALAGGDWRTARTLRVQAAIDSDVSEDWWLATEAALRGGACDAAARSLGRVRAIGPGGATLDSLVTVFERAGCSP
jgi:hypothetical protein